MSNSIGPTNETSRPAPSSLQNDSSSNSRSNDLFPTAFRVLEEVRDLLTTRANDYYKTLDEQGKITKQAEAYLADIETAIKNKTTELDSALGYFLLKHLDWGGSTVEEVAFSGRIYEDKLTHEDLLKVQEKLRDFCSARTDMSATANLKIQSILQKYNNVNTWLTNIYSLLFEINKQILRALG